MQEPEGPKDAQGSIMYPTGSYQTQFVDLEMLWKGFIFHEKMYIAFLGLEQN